MVYGVNLSWTSPMVKKLNSTEDNPLDRILTVDESSWVATIPTLGSIIGCLIYGALGQMLSRKAVLTSVGIPFAAFYITMAFAKNIWLLYFLRFISGVSGGGLVTMIPLYLGEIAKPKVRGRIFLLSSIASNAGYLITYSTAPFIPFFWYHIAMAILPMIFLVIFPIFAIESPYYIIRKDPVRAETILKQLREKNDVTEEFHRMKMGIQEMSEKSFVSILTTKGSRKALIISLGVATFFMLAGIMIVLTYTQLIMDSAGGAWTPEINTIIVSVFQVIVSVASTTVTDRYGRKPLLAISFGVISLSEITLGTYFILKYNGTDVTSVVKWLPILCMVLFVAASSFAGIAPSLTGELFPMKTRDFAMAINIVYTGGLGFLTTFFFQRLQNAIGIGQSFLIFAGFAACAVIFVLTVLVETRGKSLEQIQDELNGIGKNIKDVKG
ncbi:hypothetical protein WA026_001701 [Henosepilachna vigintioctopunctata]